MQMILSSLLTRGSGYGRSHGEEGVEGKCRKDIGHDLWYRPGPPAEFRCLSYRSRKQ